MSGPGGGSRPLLETTGLDLGSESVGLLPSRQWKRRRHRKPWYPGETLITGIGQGFTLTTPLQLASATATLATRGLRLQPQLVERIIDGHFGTEHVNAPRIVLGRPVCAFFTYALAAA